MNESNDIAIARIVVGVDLSEGGDDALREAMRLCRWLPGSELHVAHVIHTENHLHDAERIDELERVLRARMIAVREHVERVCAPLKEQAPFTQEIVFHVRLGDASAALHQVAVDYDADLIVVGTQPRRRLEKWILGSVAEALVRSARVPVLVARRKDLAELPRSERAEPLRPGEDLTTTGLSNRFHLEFVPQTTHISGLL